MENIQHPDITLLEQGGVPQPEETYVCPICGEELWGGDEVYTDLVSVLGCKNCVFIEQAADRLGQEEQEI